MTGGEDLKIARGFGSFHSSNYNQQIEHCEQDDYEPPQIPVHLPTFEEYRQNPPKFGREMKEKHFFIDKDWTFLNHGAFGSTLKETMLMKQELEIYVEKQPVRFIDRVLFPQMVYAQKRIAKFIGCNPSDICFVENATTGTNSILNSLNVTADDVIYHLDTIYGAVKKSLANLQKRTNVKIQSETLKYPVQSEDQILHLVATTLKEGTKMALFDHIPSQTAFVMPVKRIIQVCHEKGVPVLIDGAHALGAVDLDLADLGADYYVTNAHKWFCSSKGCAVLYTRKDLQAAITGPNISHGYGFGFQSEFSYVGLKDYSPFISLHASLNFWTCIGADVIRAHIRQLMTSAAKLLMTKWDNSFLLAPIGMHATMFCISLPSRYYANRPVTYEDGEKIQNILYKEHKMEIPIKVVQGVMGCRCSFHIYNVIDEYDRLADATQSDDDQRYDVTLVQIDVLDVNDNAPTIHLLRDHVKLHENSVIGSYVTSANITDNDGNTGFTLDFIPSGFLTADSRTGEITVAENEIFDREIDEELQFQIVATENDTLERYRSQSVTLTVEIMDDNDNNPTFGDHQHHLHISEATQVATVILQMKARDDDVSDEYSRVTYELVASGDDDDDDVSRLFHVTPDGDVTLSHELDAETMTSYRFKIEARDDGGRKDECEVEVSVGDVNDNPPQFVDDVTHIEISEAFQLNATFGSIKATDPDVNDTLQYSIRVTAHDGDDVITPPPFHVTEQGDLQLVREADREENSEFRIFANVTDGIHMASRELIITINDVNDNAPVFVEKFYRFQLLFRSQDGNRLVSIGQVQAIDADIGRNGVVNYSMCYDESNFSVEGETGQIFLISPYFNFKGKHATFHFCVVAIDTGSPSMTSLPAHVSVHVIREDYTPEVESRMLRDSYHVVENVDRKQLVTSLEAKDGEAEVGFNLSHPLFQITSGQIWANADLDAETLHPHYDVTIETYDRQAPDKSTNTTITIYIDDIDDNRPYFPTDHYDVTIDEGVMTSSLVRLQVRDDDRDDVNRNHVFRLVDDDVTSRLFRIDPDTGDLSNTRPFDYDVSMERHYNVTVSVASRTPILGDVITANAHRTCDVTVTVRDVNDNSPRFRPMDVGVESTCDDVTDNGDGDVTTPGCYLYRMELDEDARVGKTGSYVRADDADSGGNGNVEYSLIREAGGNYYFDIDRTTGELEQLRAFDYETDDVTEYHLRVRATDRGVPPNTNQISVIVDELTGDVYVSNAHRDAVVTYAVDVSDTKHRVPIQVEIATKKCKKFDQNLRFPRKIFNFRVKEDAPPDSVVATVPGLATTAISAIELVDPSDMLTLDDVTGEIRLRGNTTGLDYDDVTCHVITSCLNAFDEVGDVISAASVVINVDDVNDNAPVFARDDYVISVKENSSPGEVLIKMEATDRDESPQLRYHINTDLLRIDDVTGVVTTATSFDREQQAQYNFTVTCDDSLHHSDVTLTLVIDDVNDNQPSFGIDEDHVTISTNQFHGDEIVIYSVKAFDADQDDDVIYSLKENYDNLFSIHPLTGAVSMFKSQFSRNYDVIIEVRDRTAELLRHDQLHATRPDDVMLLHVINDQDDSEAVKDGMFIAFLQKVHNIDIQIPVSAGLVVERLYVTNRSAIVMFFISTMSPLPFSIPDPRIGEIVTNRMLSRSASYEFVVQVEDACTGHVFDRAIVRINISLTDQRSALLTNHDVGIPHDSNIGYQISTTCDGKDVDIYNEEATKYFAYSPQYCNLVLVSSVVHLSNQTIQVMLYEEKGNVSQSIYCHVTGNSNELFLYINHSIDEIRTFDIVDSIQRCIGEDTRVGIVKILPLNDAKIRLNLFAYNKQHQLLNATNFIKLFKQRCFSPEDDRNQLFPLNVVGMETASEAEERQKQVKKPTLEVAVASLAIVCGLLIFGFLVIGLVHFVNRERRKFENQQAEIIALSKSEIPQMNIYMNTSSSNNSSHQTTPTRPLPSEGAAGITHLPPTNSFSPNKPNEEEGQERKKKMKMVGIFSDNDDKHASVSLRSFHSSKPSPASTRRSYGNKSSPVSTATTTQGYPDVVISDYQVRMENEKSSRFGGQQIKEVSTQQTEL